VNQLHTSVFLRHSEYSRVLRSSPWPPKVSYQERTASYWSALLVSDSVRSIRSGLLNRVRLSTGQAVEYNNHPERSSSSSETPFRHDRFRVLASSI